MGTNEKNLSRSNDDPEALLLLKNDKHSEGKVQKHTSTGNMKRHVVHSSDTRADTGAKRANDAIEKGEIHAYDSLRLSILRANERCVGRHAMMIGSRASLFGCRFRFSSVR
jgi:hypothetical protein